MSWLLRPVAALREGLERIGRGDLETPMRLKDRTEIGLLADTVNTMALQLKASRDETRAKEEEIIDTQKEVILRLGAIVESRSRETANHIIRVGKSAQLLARLAGLSDEEADLVLLASPMHDVGKVAIPDTILNKPGRLTSEEFDVVKRHTTIGYTLLSNSERPIMKTAAVIAHEHHEKWDGSGYPRGLRGETIHVYGRIVAITDVFDALRSKRAYKRALTLEETLEIMMDDSGKHFDPRLLDLFVKHIDRFVEIAEQHGTDSEEEIRTAA
jgi:putative two-component system response regulator